MRAERDLDTRLNVGLQFTDYLHAVGNARVAYSNIRFKQLDPQCIVQVGVPLENALNDYIKASGTWNDCIQSGCSFDSITPKLQAFWKKAGQQIRTAERHLAAMQGT